MYNVVLRRCRETVVAMVKQLVLHILSVCVCVCVCAVLVVQHSNRMRHIVICVPPGSTIFSTLFH
jgi:hypothetical protein